MSQASDHRDAIKAHADALYALAEPAPTQPLPPDPPGYVTPPGAAIISVPPGTPIEPEFAKLPSGQPGEIHLTPGATYPDAYITYARSGGASPTARHVIRTKPGGPRAKLLGELHVGVGDKQIFHVTVSDLDCPKMGPSVKVWGGDIRVERVSCAGAVRGLLMEGESATKRLAGGVVSRLDSWGLTGGSMAHDFYAWGVDGLTVEDCVLDLAAGEPDMFTHRLYIQAACTAVTVRRNAILRGNDCQLRSGCTLYDNLFIGMACDAVLGCGTSNENVPGGVVIDDKNNVSLGGIKARHLGNIKSGTSTNNVWADSKPGAVAEAAYVQAGFSGVSNLNWHHNVRRKHGPVNIASGLATPGCQWTQLDERTDLYGVDLSLGSFGFPDIFAALRAGQTTAPAINAMVRQRLGMAP